MRQEREQELNNMQEALSKLVETRRTPNGMVMILPDSTFRFAFDSAELTQKNRELLSRIAGMSAWFRKAMGWQCTDIPTMWGRLNITSSFPNGARRRWRIIWFSRACPPDIVTVKGYGKPSPIVNASTAEARAKNRQSGDCGDG